MNGVTNGLIARPSGTAAVGSRVSARVVTDFAEINRYRSIWGREVVHRDADFDVYRTVLECSPNASTPRVVVVERRGEIASLYLGTLSVETLRIKFGYFSIPIRSVRVWRFVYRSVVGEQSAEVCEQMVAEMVRCLKLKEVDVIDFGQIETSSELYQHVTRAMAATVRGYLGKQQAHWMMKLPPPPASFRETLSREHRKKLRSEAKKFATAFPGDLTIETFATEDELPRLLDETESVAATTYQRGLGVGFSRTRQILSLLKLEAEKKWLCGYVLKVKDQPCAFWIGSVRGDTFLSEYLAHDPSYSKYSPGSYLLTHGIEDLCQRGVRHIDLGIGEAFYKKHFGNHKWEEAPAVLFADTWQGTKVRILRSFSVAVESKAKRLLERTGLLHRIKKAWRDRLAKSGTSH
jgi:hypothetical protein